MYLGELMSVRPHRCLTRLMRQALDKRLSELGTNNGQDWFITKTALKDNADRLEEGLLPEDAISWVSNVGRVTLTEQPKDMEGLYEELVRAGFAKTVPKAQLLYGILCQQFLHRIVVENKPVDLGFAKIQATPLRSDFMRLFSAHTMRRILHAPSREKIVRQALRDGRLMFLNKTRKIVLWNIAVRHSHAWWQGIRKSELALLKQQGRVHYMLRVKDRLRAAEPILYEIFTDYIAQAHRPALKIPARTGKRDHKKRFVKPSLRAVKRLFRRRQKPRPVAAPEEEGAPTSVGQPNEIVHEVPGVQSPLSDVWHSGGDVDKRGEH